MKNRKASQLRFPGKVGDYSTNLPTEPDVKISLIRFLEVARFHTTKLQPTPQLASLISVRVANTRRSEFGSARADGHYTQACTIRGRGNGYFAIKRPNACQLSLRPPRRFSQ